MATGQHLTQEQISAWVIGERSSESVQHMRGCSACHAEVLLLGTTLLDFRGAVRAWSREHTTSAVICAPAAIPRPLLTFNRACLVMVAAILCVWLGISLRPQHLKGPTGRTISDPVLMSQVDDEISRTVPTAMEPLLQLVAWQGDDSGAPTASLPLSNKRREGAAN